VLNDALAQVLDRYHISGPQIWDASEFGAATRRNRMFVIGMRRGIAPPFGAAQMDALKKPAATVKSAISDISNAAPIAVSDDGFDRWKITRPGPPSAYAGVLRSSDRTFTSHKATIHTDAVVKRFASVKTGETDLVGRHPRLAWDGLCPTLRAGTGSDRGSYQAVRPIHPTENRVITVREAARLQGFPDSHLFHPTVWHSFRMIGNSVSPIMARAIFLAIKAHLAGAEDANSWSNTGTNEKHPRVYAPAAE
jgi:DNA (cytosine-5)-methyltransferase 1